MKLRDYFAAKAMQALLRNPNEGCIAGKELAERLSKAAYVIADAMIEERKK